MKFLRYRANWKQIGVIAFCLFLIAYIVWVTSDRVLANRTLKTAHIFPTAVEAVGWNTPEHALTQELAATAPLPSFNTENSAYIVLDARPETNAPTEEAPVTPVAEPPDPSVTEPTAPSEEAEQPPLEQQQEPEESTPQPEPVPEENMSETNDPIEQSEPPPAEEPPQEVAPPPVEEPVLPEPEVTPPPESPAESPPEVPPEASLYERAREAARAFVNTALSHAVTTAFATTTSEEEADEAMVSTSAATTTPAEPEPEEAAPTDTTSIPDVATCEVLAKECHTLEVSGFNFEGDLSEKRFQRVELNFSFAYNTPESDVIDDRLLVRYYHAGEWREAGEIFLNKELSNGTNGGYFTSVLDIIDSWDDLSDIRVVVEFDRGSDNASEVYLDGVWLGASYRDRVQDIWSGETETPDVPGNVEFELGNEGDMGETGLVLEGGREVAFPYIDELSEGVLVMRADKSEYWNAATTTGEDGPNIVHMSVANTGAETQMFRLYAALAGKGTLKEVSRFLRNVPVTSERSVEKDVTYFCEGLWQEATTTGHFLCAETGEEYACTSLNESGENCLVEQEVVDIEETIEYGSSWVPAEVREPSEEEQAQFTDEFVDGFTLAGLTAGEFEIQGGQTAYFRIVLETDDAGPQRFILAARNERFLGDLESTLLRDEASWLAEEKAASKDNTKKKVNARISNRTNFDADELPEFRFRFATQQGFFARMWDRVRGRERSFEVARTRLRDAKGIEKDTFVDVEYAENGEWTLKFKKHPRAFRPGKHTVELTITEGKQTFVEEYEFYWGVLAVNSDKTIYAPGENAFFSMAALDDAGSTICDATLELVVTDPSGGSQTLDVSESGECGPNNVVDVPDYSSAYVVAGAGEYRVALTSFDDAGSVVHRITDAFQVRENEPFTVKRSGPTRIYPKAPYTMAVTVTAGRDFEGVITEALPPGFIVLEKDGGELSIYGEALRLSWNVTLQKGETRTFRYEFDAPDISPYLYVLGPFTMNEGGTLAFEETRTWKIASDALGEYVEKHNSWSPTTAGAWEAKDLSGSPFNVPANAVLEIAVVNSDVANEWQGGIRHASSSLARIFDIHEPEPQGTTEFVMHVQASATSSIQTFAESTTNISFVLLGYWTNGYYVERFDQIDPNNANNTWGNINLNTFGAASGTVAEMVVGNWNNANTPRIGGVRRQGSSLTRSVDIHESEAGGVNGITMLVVASGTTATIQGFAEVEGTNDADIDYWLVGYWSVKPTGLDYTERFDTITGPASNSTWTDAALSGFTVPSTGIAEVLFANAAAANSSMLIGARTNGSTIDRSRNIHEAEAGGWSLGRTHVTAGSDANSTIELFTDDNANDQFRLLGYWSAANLPPNAPTLYDQPFFSEKTGDSTPIFLFSATDPDGTSSIVYQIQWDDDAVLDDSPIGDRISSNESGCSPNCFQNLSTPADTSPFNEGDQIEFTIQTPLVSGTTYYWRVRATDVSGSNIESEWSTTTSFTYVANTAPSQWMQTQDAQFDTGTLNGTETYGSNAVRLSADPPVEALMAYGEGTVQTPRYRIWDGDSWGTEASAQSVGGTIQWVVTKAAPTRNEYVLGTQDAANDVNVQVYDGDAATWGDLLEVTTTISDNTARGFDVAYESLSGDAIVVYCDGDADPAYRVWNGTSWAGPTAINLTSANNCEWIKLASDPTSDEIILVSRDTAAGGTDYEALVWNGSSWGNSETLGNMTDTLNEGIAVEYEESGDQAVVAVSNGDTSGVTWTSWNGAEWSVVSTQGMGDDFEWGIMKRDNGSDNMVLCYADQDDDLGILRWDGDGWQANQEFDIGGNTAADGTVDGRPISCEFETTAGRDGYIMIPYSDTTNARYQFWDGSTLSGENTISTIQDSWSVQSVRTGEGKILASFHDDVSDRYDFSYWDGSAWGTAETLENTPSVTAEPIREPLAMAARLYQSASGSILSDPIDFDWVPGQPSWGEALFSTTEPVGTNVVLHVLYESAGACTWLVPDTLLPGNATSTGFDVSASPIDLSSLSTSTYNRLCLRATFTSSNQSLPVLNDWTVSWERQPYLTQARYRWYVNTASLTPTDPWPTGGADISENTPLSTSLSPPGTGEILRLRMAVLDESVALSASALSLTLQYAEGSTCSADLTWLDVGGVGSTTAKWRGYDNASLTDGATLPSSLLSESDVRATYEESNDTAVNPNGASINDEIEWDWVLQHNASSSVSYCFRVITADGELLNAYDSYPSLITNSAPGTPLLDKPFDNEAVASTSPWFEFSAEDPEGNDITYQIQIDDDYAFGSPALDRNSQDHFNDFTNIITPSDKDPFNSGQTVRFIPASALSNNTTYFWRVRAKDRNASAEWSGWSSVRSVHINTGITITTWFQTAFEQFLQNTHDDTEATSTNETVLTPPLTAGTTTSSSIDFDWLTTGNSWGALSWNDTETGGTITYHIEYLNGSSWELIPDADLSGNSTGFGTSPVSLLGLSPTIYNEIRIRANFAQTSATPRLADWTLSWGLAVSQPTVTSLFDNEKTGTTTPSFGFSSTDPQNDDLVYQISWSQTTDFAASTTRSSDADAGFTNMSSTTDTSPFVAGDSIRFSVQTGDVLTNGNTYWWRVRARDPSGGNAWSVWSTLRSFTVDTTVNVSTWFQTTDAQFLTDTLNDTETSGSDSARVTTVIREAFAAYGEGSVQAPRFRIWNGTSWGSENTGQNIGDTIRFVEAAAAPTRDEYVIGTMGSTGVMDVQVYNGTTDATGNLVELAPTASSNARRGFDIAYETSSGDAIAVACSGTEAVYRVWNGSSWTATSTITLAISNNCEWIKLASDPTSDEIILVARDTTAGATDYQALVWNGSSWGNSATFGSQVTAANEGIAVAYEESGGQAIVIVSDGANNDFIWNAWNGSSWSGTNTVATGNDFAGGRIARDVGTDNMALCYIDIDADIGYALWDGSAWGATTEFEGLGNSANGRPFTCEYETVAGRDGYLMMPYSDTTVAEYVFWNGSVLSGAAALTTISDSWELRSTRTGDNNILVLAYDDANTEYDFTYWNGSAWAAETVLETASITTGAPAPIPLDIVARRYPSFTTGAVLASAIDFDDGLGPKWQSLSWTDSTPGSSDILYQVEYFTATSSWALIPDVDLSGNSTGTSTSPLNLGGLNRNTYNVIRPVANLNCVSGQCPTLSDWTVAWSEGIVVSGTAQQYDQSTNVTSGTVAVAVNGVLQSGKTATISNGTWSIQNVTVFQNDIVTVFIDSAATTSEAVGITKYDGEGDVTGMSLYERHLSLGSNDNPTITNVDLGQYDNSISGDEDVFHEVDAGNDVSACAISGCDDVELWIKAGTTYRPDSASSGNVTTHDIEVNGTMTMDGNTFTVSGSWDNNATTTANTSTVIFSATSTTETVDSTGALTYSFNNVTFGQGSGTATWNLASTLDVNGNLAVNFGTLNQNGNKFITVAGNLSIGSSGLFTKGTASTTFDGTGSSSWTDSTVSKQDMGDVHVNGSTKTVNLGSNVKATDITIGADDTLDATNNNYALEVMGNFTNNNSFVARSGTVTFTATDTGNTIQPGSSSFHNLTFNGSGGNWAFSGSTVTVGNDLTISNGIVTLPTATTTVAGNFDVTSGSFMHNNGIFLLNASGSKTIRPSSSSFYDLVFNGSGSWSFPNNQATSSRHTTITAGTVTLPSGVLAVGGSFTKNGGSFSHNSGTLKFTAADAQSIRLNNSDGYNLTFAGSGSWSFTDTNATTTNTVRFESGTLTLPSGIFAVGGSWTRVGGSFTHNSGTVKFNSSDTGETVTTGGSWFSQLLFDSPTGGWTMTDNATSTASTTIARASSFTVGSGVTLAVSGTFTNAVGGASTTWTGSTLFLNSSTNYTINTKTSGADTYENLIVASSTDVRMWNSSAAATAVSANSSLYSQDHAAIDGDLYIWGEYVANNEYWNYADDFDGTALGGSARQVDVRIAGGSSIALSSGNLRIVGTSTATTTIANQGTGEYALAVSGGTLNAQYYEVRNTDAAGLSLSGTPTVTSLSNGDYELGVTAGSMLTIASTVIDQNPAFQIQQVRFATSTGVPSGFNVVESGTPTSYWWFRNHYGNFDGEDFDSDPGGNPGYIRWDDSGIDITVSGNVYSDHGSTAIGNPPCDGSTQVVRVVVIGVATSSSYSGSCNAGTGAYSIANVQFTGDVVLWSYLNTGGGRRAVTVTKTPTSNITDMHLYENALIVRHEDTAPMTIADLAVYDEGDDSDIFYTAATGTPTLVVRPEKELFVWGGKTFAPGGDVTLESGGSGDARDGRLELAASATFTASGAESHAIGGGLAIGSGATFTAANSTVTFTATTTGKIINSAIPLSLYNVSFNGSGGGWALNSSATTTVQNTITVSAGTLSGTGSLVINSGALTGNGTVALTGGTVELLGTGSLGSASPWQFNNLTLGSGSAGTTTRTGVGTTTVAGILRVVSNQVLRADSAPVVLAGGGTPFVVDGTFTVQSAPFYYTSTAAANVADETYAALTFAPSSGSPTYTILGGILSAESMTVGDGVNGVVVNANTNDPSMAVSDDVLIRSNATFVASNVGAFEIAGSWTNNGTFTHSNGTVLFDSTDTGETILAGPSSFSTLTFDSAGGGWTIAGNATTTSNFSLANATSFTVSSGVTLAVGGTFTNSVGGGATTWTDSYLTLNSGTSYSGNTKTTGGDTYGTLTVASSTDVRLWNSSAATTSVSSNSSLYSQDHAAIDGDLYIWGEYMRATGSDYWSYATDFDGTALGGSSRQVDVRVASSSTLLFSGGVLDIIGTSTATTTVANQGAGTYGFTVSGGTFAAQYYQFRNINSSGVVLTGTPTISTLSDGDYELEIAGGSMVTVGGTVIDSNPLKIFMRNRFATSTGVASGFNVTATGTSVSSWKYNLHYGNYAGEAFDSDPQGDPGYLRWDDSAAQITISGNVYSDEGTTVSSVCDGSTPVVRVRVQGASVGTSSCNSGTGLYSVSNISFNPGDVLTVYLDTDGGRKAANISVDPITTISNMHLYEDRVIVRHEDTAPLNIADMALYDFDDDPDIQYDAEDAATDTLTLPPETKLIVWDSKTFAPAGDVTLQSGGSGNAWDGTLELRANAVFSAAGTQSHSIGGSFLVGSGGSLSSASSTFTFTATTTGKTIQLNGTSFNNIVFNGSGGNWAFNGAATANDFTITNGTVTLPNATTTIAGSFDNSGGTFMHNNGLLLLTASGSKNVRGNGSSFYNMTASSTSGTWTFLDTHATSSNNFIVTAGTVVLPTGIFAVGGSFENSGTFTHSGGTVKLTAAASGKNIAAGASSFAYLELNGVGGAWTFLDTNATTTADFSVLNGSTTLPAGVFAVGGSFTNAATFVHATTGTVKLTATTTGKTINPGPSSFSTLTFDSAGGGWTIAGNATTTSNFSLANATSFTVSSGVTLAVGGTFTNSVGGGATTWTDSYLTLNSGTSYSGNTKTTGGDTYGTLTVASSTDVRLWNSSAATTSVSSNSSLYSQDHAAIDGDLYIWGEYMRATGSDYWSYATDFDGTALGGSSRQVDVRVASSSSLSFSSGGTLAMIGTAAATTTVDVQGSGKYALAISGGTLNASYYQFRNLDANGLAISGSPAITSLSNGDFEMSVVSGGAMITVAGSAIDANASKQISNVRFATSTGVTGGFNVKRTGSPISAWTFVSSNGNYDGESFDDDGGDACGQIRWDDSACLFVSQEHFRWRNDDGGEGAPASEWFNASWSKRKKVAISNPTGSSYTNIPVKLVVTYDGDMQSDFDDLRFTDSSGTTTVSHWIESVNAAASSTVWVEVPSLPASGSAVVYMYYGNGSASSSADGSATFAFFDDFEDDNISEYSGDTTLFQVDTSFNHNGSFGLEADLGDEGAQTSSGIRQTGTLTQQGQTIRYFQYVDSTQDDEPCTLFAVGGSGANYAVCLDQFPSDKLIIAENVTSNDGSGSVLASTTVSYSSQWYEVEVDWLTSNDINVTVYDASGSVFATATTSDSTRTSGGIGFSFWGQHGGWDFYSSRQYIASDPTYVFGIEQTDSGATWKLAEDSALSGQSPNENVRLRFSIKNSGAGIFGQLFRLQVASKGASLNCESVPYVNYNDVPTTSGGCGSSAACMTSSSQFIDQTSTAGLLTYPANYSFAAGQILEDPSNQTSSTSVASLAVTEVEYNFQMTNNATQNAYCFRTSNGGLDLDNYSRVAEIVMSHPPQISNFALNNANDLVLTEGATTTVSATGTVTDLNGYDDIIAATSTIYRSGVGVTCSANDNNCYQLSTTSCSFSNCSGTSCTLACSADIEYFAEPTDAGAFSAENWLSRVQVEDSSGATDVETSFGVELLTLYGLSVDANINFGALEVGQDTGATNATTTIANTGNSSIDIQLAGTNLTGGASSIAVGEQKFATTTFVYSACAICQFLTGTSTSFEVDLPKPTSTSTPSTDDVYWGINVPSGTGAVLHEGTNTFIATSD